MRRIGIVGSENSHALAYATLLNIEQVRDDARAVAIWGEEEARTREVAGKAEIPEIVASSRDLLGKVDAVFVENRHGGLHAEHALPFLEAGLPVFVDKPLAVSLEECGRLIATANRTGAWLASFSSLRTTETTSALAATAAGIGEIRAAQLAGPCDFESVYGGPFFYATHTIEIALRLLGEEVRAVNAVRSGTSVTAVLDWENGAHAALTYLTDAKYAFHATLFGKEGMAAGEILANHDGYRTAIGIILDGMASGKRPFGDEQLVRPVAIVHAMEASLANGGAAVEVEPLIARALGAS